MHAGDTGLQSLKLGAVMNGVKKEGDQVGRLRDLKATHVLQGKLRLRAARGCSGQHRLVDVEPAAGIAGIDEMADVRASAAGEVQMPRPAVAEQLLQPVDTVALRPVVDVRTHEIVITRQVGIESIAGHDDLMCEETMGARILSRPAGNRPAITAELAHPVARPPDTRSPYARPPLVSQLNETKGCVMIHRAQAVAGQRA